MHKLVVIHLIDQYYNLSPYLNDNVYLLFLHIIVFPPKFIVTNNVGLPSFLVSTPIPTLMDVWLESTTQFVGTPFNPERIQKE